MHDGRLRQLLAELFAAHGFETTVDAALEGRSGGFYTAPVLAEQGDFAVLIERCAANEHLTGDKVQELTNVVEDIGAEQGLIVHLGPIDADAAQHGAGRIVLWDADRLARLVGNARLHDAADVPLDRLPLEAPVPSLETTEHEVGPGTVIPDAFTDMFAAPAPEAPEPSAFSMFNDAPEPASTQQPTPQPARSEPLEEVPVFGGIDLDALESMDTTAPTPDPAPTPTATPAAPAMDPFPADNAATHPVLPPRLTADEAAARVRDRLYLVESKRLVLQPVHLLDYECDLLVEGSLRYDTVAGRLQVHGTNKAVGEVDSNLFEPRIAGACPPGPVRERDLRVSHERAMELARDTITAAHTRLVEIETTDESEDVCVTERKQVAPRPDHVRIQHLGVVHRPQWELRGPNGALLVDAVTGEPVAEELRSADPGVVMLD